MNERNGSFRAWAQQSATPTRRDILRAGAGLLRRRLMVGAALLFVLALIPTGFPRGMSTTAEASDAPSAAAGTGGFVERVGSRLMLDGKPFRFGGANVYWLGLDENVGDPAQVDYPTRFRIRDGLETARGMGATVVRSHTLGVSTGSPLSLEPSLDTFNDRAFATIDYSVAEAHRLGLRLVIPLTDDYRFYEGGRSNFTDWYGLPADAFYTDPRPIGAFERYIDHLLTHVNPYTGKAYKDDPTIMAWELGNELSGMTDSWIREISGHLVALAPHQLVAAGQVTGINPATLAVANVDIVDVHYYPPTPAQMLADAKTVTDAGKAYMAGEYGSNWASKEVFDPLVADTRVTGALFWSLFAHNDTYGYVQHGDGFTLHYPGDDPQMRDRVRAISDFQHSMCSSRCNVGIPLGQPLMTSTTKRFGMNILAWRGTALAAGYRVQRSTVSQQGPWQAAVPGLVTDNETPLMDLQSPPQAAWYRVVPVDVDGLSGPPSTPVFVKAYDGPPTPPAAFDQVTPAPDAQQVNTRPEYVWNDPGDASYFRLVVSEHPDFSAPVIDLNGLQTTRVRPQTELTLNQTYYWKVTATNINGTTAAANAGAAFTTGRPSTPLVVDDFESYASDTALRAAYPPHPSGDPVTPSLVAGESGNAMRLDYTLGSNGFAAVLHAPPPTARDWWGLAGLRFWLQPDGSGRPITVQIQSSGLYYWAATFTPTGTEPRLVTLPFSDFQQPSWAQPGPLDLNSITDLDFVIGGTTGPGTLTIDSITAVPFSD